MTRVLLIIVVLGLVAALPAYSITQLNRTYVDASRGNRQIGAQIYYPVADAAAPQKARVAFPLLVFGHGWIMPPSTYSTLRNELVSQGWIMAFPSTEGSLFPNHLDFALDLNFVAQSVLAENFQTDSELNGIVAQFSVLMGHSMGGGAAVLAASDTAANAIITLAAAETNPSAIAAAQQVGIPSLTLAAGNDSVTPPAQHQVPIFENLASSFKSYVSFNGLGHLNIYGNALVIEVIQAWLAYTLNGEISALLDYFELLDQHQEELIHIHFGYPEVAAADETNTPALAGLEVYPNPASASANIRYKLELGSEVLLSVYDLRGRRVRRLYEGNQAKGWHSLIFDGKDDRQIRLGRGIYLARLRASGRDSVGWITLLD